MSDDSQVSIQVLTNAIQQMQETQRRLVEAVDKLTQHDYDPEAHEEIRKMIYALQDSETIYTRTQIGEIINSTIAHHLNEPYSTAHPGFNEFLGQFNVTIANIQDSIRTLQQKVDGNTTGTDLEIALQAIEDKYAPILNNLQQSFKNAEEAGSEVLVEEYRNVISRTLDEKKAEIMAVLEAYNS